jgi:hypothetical protein
MTTPEQAAAEEYCPKTWSNNVGHFDIYEWELLQKAFLITTIKPPPLDNIGEIIHVIEAKPALKLIERLASALEKCDIALGQYEKLHGSTIALCEARAAIREMVERKIEK